MTHKTLAMMAWMAMGLACVGGTRGAAAAERSPAKATGETKTAFWPFVNCQPACNTTYYRPVNQCGTGCGPSYGVSPAYGYPAQYQGSPYQAVPFGGQFQGSPYQAAPVYQGAPLVQPQSYQPVYDLGPVYQPAPVAPVPVYSVPNNQLYAVPNNGVPVYQVPAQGQYYVPAGGFYPAASNTTRPTQKANKLNLDDPFFK